MTTVPKCPICAAVIEWARVTFTSPFRCPNCRRELQIPSSYFMLQAWIDVFISGPLAYALGFRGYGLLFATICILPLSIFATAFLYRRFIPPKLKPYHPGHLRLDFLHEPPQDEQERGASGPSEIR